MMILLEGMKREKKREKEITEPATMSNLPFFGKDDDFFSVVFNSYKYVHTLPFQALIIRIPRSLV